jgi:hypothetical protein
MQLELEAKKQKLVEGEKEKKKIWFPDYVNPPFSNKMIDSVEEINKYDYFFEG